MFTQEDFHRLTHASAVAFCSCYVLFHVCEIESRVTEVEMYLYIRVIMVVVI